MGIIRVFRRKASGISLQLRLRGGEGGIRTLGTGVSPYNGLANRRLQPLGHLSTITYRLCLTHSWPKCVGKPFHSIVQFGVPNLDVLFPRNLDLGMAQHALNS